MKSMVLTFEWTDNGHDDDNIVDEREFIVKDEEDVKKDIAAWVEGMYKADNGKHKNFEVCRRRGCKDGRGWVVYGTKSHFNWLPNFMLWAATVMSCTMNYLGWERDIDADNLNGNGYTFISSNGVVKHFKNMVELDKFILDEMSIVSSFVKQEVSEAGD